MQEQDSVFEFEDPFVEVLRIFAARGRAIREQRAVEQRQDVKGNVDVPPVNDETPRKADPTPQDN